MICFKINHMMRSEIKLNSEKSELKKILKFRL